MNITLTLIGQSISFALFVLFCMKFVWPPIMAILRERQKKISDGLLAAEKGHRDFAHAQEKTQSLVEDGKKQAQQILANAQKQAAQIVEGAKQDAENEKKRILNSAEQEMEQQISQARTSLYQELGRLISEGVRKILQKEVDMKAHEGIIASLNRSA